MATARTRKKEVTEPTSDIGRRVHRLADEDEGEPQESVATHESAMLSDSSDVPNEPGSEAASLDFAQLPLVRLELTEEAESGASEGSEDARSQAVEDEGAGSSRAEVAIEAAPRPATREGTRRRAPRKVRTEEDRAQQRRVASAQRLRHEELLREWMPTQRGANMTLSTRIGSQTVEGWFKRTFVRLSRMLYRIHTFPMQQLTPEAIAVIEKEVLTAIGKAEAALSRQLAQCEEMLARVGGRRAFYAKHFELEIIVSTKTAIALHAVYHRADEVMLVVESLDFAGLLTEAHRRKQIGAMHASIFGLAQSIERLHRGLYVRAAKGSTEVAEVDAVEAVAAGGPVDLDLSPSPTEEVAS